MVSKREGSEPLALVQQMDAVENVKLFCTLMHQRRPRSLFHPAFLLISVTATERLQCVRVSCMARSVWYAFIRLLETHPWCEQI